MIVVMLYIFLYYVSAAVQQQHGQHPPVDTFSATGHQSGMFYKFQKPFGDEVL